VLLNGDFPKVLKELLLFFISSQEACLAAAVKDKSQ
jgi:hypothetical protein